MQGTIANRVKEKRIEKGFTQSELAEKVGIKQQSLQAIESGLTKRPRNLLEIATVLDCDPHWLMYGHTLSNK